MDSIFSIGIDPGSRTGIAVWDGVNEQIVTLETRDFSKIMPTFFSLLKEYEGIAVIGIEVPRSKHAYNRSNQGPRAMKKIAHNVGDCYRKAKSCYYYIDAFVKAQGLDIVVYEIGPGRTKLSRREFWSITGWPESKPSSSHSRDAGMIAIRAYDLWRYNKLVDEAGK